MKYPLPVFWRVLLSPFSVIYQIVMWIRNWLYDVSLFRVHEFSVPVISVGNITVGGTGKTPHVEYLVRMLKEKYGVAVLSRGYKRKSKGFLLADERTTVDDIGDEPWQIHRKFPDVKVIVDANRVRALEKIEKEMEDVQVVILDDAFQHRSVKAGLSILLIEYDFPLSGEQYLPAGRMRESRHEKKRADIVLFTKCPEQLKPIEERIRVKHFHPFPYQQVYFTKIVYGRPVPLFPEEAEKIGMEMIREKKIPLLAVTGIANPEPFHKYLKRYSERTGTLSFPDHHRYGKNDMTKIGERLQKEHAGEGLIFTTEKDAVRIMALPAEEVPYHDRWYYIPVEVAVLRESERVDFENKILEYVGNNQRNRRFHQE
jgi:tetraacyldisaccharide 4'-kinase